MSTAETPKALTALEPDDVETINISFAYWLVDDSDWAKIIAADRGLGWGRKPWLRQIVTGFCAVPAHWAWFAAAAELDAKARGYSEHQGAHFDALAQWSNEVPLADYVDDSAPDFADKIGPLPVADVGLELPEKTPGNRRMVKELAMSPANMACLHLYCIAADCGVIEALALMTKWHLHQYWGRSYTRQLESSRQKTLNPNL